MNALMQWYSVNPCAQYATWALIHFLWQGTVIAGLLAVVLYLVPRRAAQVRWAAACLAMGLMAAAPILTACRIASGAAVSRAQTVAVPGALEHSQLPALPTPSVAAALPYQSVLSTQGTAGAMVTISAWVLPIWLAGVLALSLWHLGGWVLLAQTSRWHTQPPTSDAHAIFDQLRQRLQVSRAVQLLESARITVPCVVGWIRPVILLPLGAVTGLTRSQLEAVLAHELGHILRYDYLIGLIQAAIETLLFYHPAVWWVSGCLRQEAEYCCDDMALRACPDRRNYAEALARIVELPWTASHLAPAATGGKVLPRMRRILGLPVAPAGGRCLAAIIVLAGLLAAGGIMYQASAAKAQSRPSSAPAPVALAQPQWGEPANGLRTRLFVEKQVFPAGQPIPMTLEIKNVGEIAKAYSRPTVPWHGGLVVLDEQGRKIPYLGGLAQVMVPTMRLDPGQSGEPAPFDLAAWYYLRRPGRYSVTWPGQIEPQLPGQDEARSAVPGTAKLEFEVVADPAAAADGDPIGRLLPLVKDQWWLVGTAKSGAVHPGSNRTEVTGRFINLQYNPTGFKNDSGLIWLWLTDEPAAEQRVTEDRPPPSDYLGKVGPRHVYIHVDPNALKAWPTAKEDIRRALSAGSN